MRVEVLYFDGCPSYRAAERIVRGVLVREDAEADVELMAVNTEQEAKRLRFPGSPTIRVDGEDLFPVPERAGYALGCRMYTTSEGLRGSPTVEMVRAALAERNLVTSVSKYRARPKAPGKANQHDGREQGHHKAGLRDHLEGGLRAGGRDRGPGCARQRATLIRPAKLIDTFKEFFAEAREAFPDLHVTVEDLVAEGDRLTARVTMRGTHQGPSSA